MGKIQEFRTYLSNVVKPTNVSGESIKELVSNANLSAPVTIASSGDIKRVSAEELENCYIFDPIVFNSINKIVQTIMNAAYDIRCDGKNSAEILNYYKKFFAEIGLVGEDTTWEEVVATIFQNQLIYGRAYLEVVYNKNMTKIVDLVTLDPKMMDYARNGSGKIVLDYLGRPVGYTQQLPYGVETEGRGDEVPDEVTLKTLQIFLLPERIAHFKLYTYGSGFDGLGVIEPAYRSIVRRQNVEEAQANSIYARGTYPVIASVGDEAHHPTPEMIKNAVDKLSQMQHNRYFAFPYWYKINTLEVKQSEVVDNTMKYLRENSSAALGLPVAFAIGSGEATNRATLNNQQKFLEYTLTDVAKKTAAIIRKQIFLKIAKVKKFKAVPYIVWGDVGTASLDEKAKRLNDYVKNGILLPEDVKPYAILSEELEKVPTKPHEPHELSKVKKV